MTTIIKGTDHKSTFVLFRDGQPIDLNEANEIEVKVYQKKDDILASYKLTDSDVVITEAVGGVCECYINRESLVYVPNGKLFIEIVVDLNDVNFANSYRMIMSDILVGELKEQA